MIPKWGPWVCEAAERAYTAYGESAGWLNVFGSDMPRWEQLPEQTRQHWYAAIAAAVEGYHVS